MASRRASIWEGFPVQLGLLSWSCKHLVGGRPRVVLPGKYGYLVMGRFGQQGGGEPVTK